MQNKDVFVIVEADAAGEARLEFAADIARSCAAHLTGAFFFNPMVPEVSALAAEYCMAGSVETFRNPDYDDLLRRSERSGDLFNECLRRNGLNGEWHVTHSLEGGLAKLARISDLVVAGQIHPEKSKQDDDKVLRCLLLDSGRPVLVVPCFGKHRASHRSILVGWDGSREAARAVADAMPYLQEARSVTVLSLERSTTGQALPDTAVAAHLGRHGINVAAAHSKTDGLAISHALLDYAADIGADMLVAGSYGHSPIREAVFGGVTRELLQHMTLPVLFSH